MNSYSSPCCAFGEARRFFWLVCCFPIFTLLVVLSQSPGCAQKLCDYPRGRNQRFRSLISWKSQLILPKRKPHLLCRQARQLSPTGPEGVDPLNSQLNVDSNSRFLVGQCAQGVDPLRQVFSQRPVPSLLPRRSSVQTSHYSGHDPREPRRICPVRKSAANVTIQSRKLQSPNCMVSSSGRFFCMLVPLISV